MKIQIEPEVKAVVKVEFSPSEVTFLKNLARYYASNPGNDSQESRSAAERFIKKLPITSRILDASELFK